MVENGGKETNSTSSWYSKVCVKATEKLIFKATVVFIKDIL
jgi:hypothetical protein